MTNVAVKVLNIDSAQENTVLGILKRGTGD